MGLEFFNKEIINVKQEQDNFYYLPIVERLKKEKWHLAQGKNIYKHFYLSPEDLFEGEGEFIDDLSHLSCYKVNLTPEQVTIVNAGTVILNGHRAAIGIDPRQVVSRIKFSLEGNLEHLNRNYFNYVLLKEENRCSMV